MVPTLGQEGDVMAELVGKLFATIIIFRSWPPVTVSVFPFNPSGSHGAFMKTHTNT
jgi:hypothetical protein